MLLSKVNNVCLFCTPKHCQQTLKPDRIANNAPFPANKEDGAVVFEVSAIDDVSHGNGFSEVFIEKPGNQDIGANKRKKKAKEEQVCHVDKQEGDQKSGEKRKEAGVFKVSP